MAGKRSVVTNRGEKSPTAVTFTIRVPQPHLYFKCEAQARAEEIVQFFFKQNKTKILYFIPPYRTDKQHQNELAFTLFFFKPLEILVYREEFIDFTYFLVK